VANTHTTGYYFAPPSHWPVVGSLALFFMAIGGVLLMNSHGEGWLPFAIGFFILVYMLFGWFGQVIRESEGGLFNVDMSFRWAMSWFIFSEVMFFAAFFGALFYARVYSLPWLGDLDNKLLWPQFSAAWPSAGPYRPPEFTPMGAWGSPRSTRCCSCRPGSRSPGRTGR
jgi:cytochrome c oxidase subunit III